VNGVFRSEIGADVGRVHPGRTAGAGRGRDRLDCASSCTGKLVAATYREGMPERMSSWEALWAVAGGLFVAGAVGLSGPAWLALAVVVIYFAGGALYWKWRLARQRRRR
jgi:hypothetical protein